MDSSVFQNTREQNHKEPPKLASAHWQPVRDSPLVAKIALGIVEERGVKEERRACWFHWDPLRPLPMLRPMVHQESRFQRGPRAVSALSLNMKGEGEVAWHGWS